MRQKRAKAYRKLMSLYCMSFGFRQPYQVLVDSEMCKASISHKIDLVKQLGTVLHGTVKPMITQCCIHELYLQGKDEQAAVDLAKSFERRKCNHREAIPGDECLASVVGDSNKHRYVISAQSQPLRTQLRSIPAVPIVHVNRSVMILEPPSDATLKAKETAEQRALLPAPSEVSRVSSTSGTVDSIQKKPKGPKGPNPLSMKKKKSKETPPSNEKEKAKLEVRAQVKDAKLGVKREHDGDDGETMESTGHKRKRRRKNPAMPATGEHDEGI